MAGGKIVQYEGARREGRAAANAAGQQFREAARQRDEMYGLARRNQADTMKAANSVEELAAYGESLGYAQKQAQADQRLIDSIDPALMEASNQVLKLLRGEQSGLGNSINAQRAQQRNKLLASLRQQLGPGAESSTAGIQALNRFDAETAALGANSQGQSLGSLMGVIQGRPENRGMGNIAQMGQLYGNRAGRIADAQFNTGQSVMNALAGGNAGVLQMTGHDQLYSQMQGRMAQQIGKEWSQDSSQFMGIMGGMFGSTGGGTGSQRNPSQSLGGGGGGNYNGFGDTTGTGAAGGSYLNAGNIA
jgi:hypothetical protein